MFEGILSPEEGREVAQPMGLGSPKWGEFMAMEAAAEMVGGSGSNSVGFSSLCWRDFVAVVSAKVAVYGGIAGRNGERTVGGRQ